MLCQLAILPNGVLWRMLRLFCNFSTPIDLYSTQALLCAQHTMDDKRIAGMNSSRAGIHTTT